MEQPKVRFTKINKDKSGQPLSLLSLPTCLAHTENEKINTCQKRSHTNKDKLKIKSIVPVKFPVKVLKNGRHVLSLDARSQSADFWLSNQLSQNDCMSPTEPTESFKGSAQISYSAQAPQSLLDSREGCLLNISSDLETSTNELFIENQYLKKSNASYSQQLKSCSDDLQRLTIKPCSTSDLPTSSKVTSSNRVPMKTENGTCYNCITIDDEDDNNDVQILKVINGSKNSPRDKQNNEKFYKMSKARYNCEITNTKTSNNEKPVNKVDRIENKENYSEKLLPNKVANTLLTVVPSILKDSTNAYNTNFKSEKKSKRSNGKINSQVMPRAKFGTPLTKNKVENQVPEAQINKKILLNVTADKCAVTVHSGSSLKNLQCKTDNDFFQTGVKKNIISKNILSHPEYNSTINVIKKLKDIENEKYIIDSEKLLPTYKNVINEKVSAALEFPSCETVYKNLISLTDDNDDKFSAIPMRSKDPEPTDKDIIPKLSDFYRPKFTGEYFMIANPIVREPEKIHICNAFKISNKISMWKVCRDSDY